MEKIDFKCTKCNSNKFSIKREVTYVYTYELNSLSGNLNKSLPFMFDNREKLEAREYLKCDECGAIYPFSFSKNSDEIDLTILQKAARCDFKDNPDFLG